MEGQCGEDVRGGALVEGLRLVLEAGEVALESVKRMASVTYVLADVEGKNLRGASVVEVDFVLNVEVCAPVADLSKTLELQDFEDGVVIVVVHEHGLLVL